MDNEEILEIVKQYLQESMQLYVQLYGFTVAAKETLGDVKISEVQERLGTVVDYITNQAEQAKDSLESEFAYEAFNRTLESNIEESIQLLKEKLEDEE